MIQNKALLQISSLLLAAIMLLAYNDDPPTGRTGAPFDGHCKDCHSGNNPGGFNGIAAIIGLPDTIMPNTTYPLQIRVSFTSGNPIRAGFQLVVVDKNNINAGDLAAINSESDTEFMNDREYLEHRPAKYFSGGPVSWDFNWTSPANALCNTIKFYYITNLCNGSGDFGDFSIAFNTNRYFDGGPPLLSTVNTVTNNTCLESTNGAAAVQASGGTSPYQYNWSNGSTSPTVSGLPTGTYTVTVTDGATCTSAGQTSIVAQDTIAPQIICPSLLIACANDTVLYPSPIVLDNCDLPQGQPILASGLASGSVFPVGITAQIFKVTDGGGNVTTCSFHVEVNNLPTVQVDTVVHDIGNTGMGMILLAAMEGSGGPLSFFWKKDGLFFPNNMEDLVGLYAGVYTVEVSDSAGCFATLEGLTIKNTTDINYTPHQVARLVLLPQPVARGVFNIEGGNNTTPASIELLNIQAEVIAVFPVKDWPGPFYIDECLPSGVYCLKVTAPDGLAIALKLIKIR